jgi:DNA-binding CsgD family transcriptional regulator
VTSDRRRRSGGTATAPVEPYSCSMPSELLPLVGRDTDLLALARHHAAVVDDRHGRVVVISGDAGIGKSRLVREFVDGIGASRPTGVGGAVDLGDQTIPLLPLRLALKDLMSSLPHDASRTDGLPFAPTGTGIPSADLTLTEVLDVLADPALAGSVLVLEDAHWADPSTLAFLRLLVTQLASLPVLVLVTHRPDLGRRHPLRATLADLARSSDVFRADLAPLGPDDVALLHLRRHGELADQATLDLLVQRGGGNPFFTIELLESEPTTIPASVEDVVTHQIEQLPPAVLALARTIAVAGRLRVDLAVELSALDEEAARDAVRAAIAAGVVTIEHGEIQLRHALLAEAVERTMLPSELRAAHGHLAELAESGPLLAYDSEVDGLARRARHWRLAGRPERAIPAAAAAADAATTAHAHHVALAQYETLLDIWDGEIAGQHGIRLGDVLVATSRAAFESGRSDVAVRCARRAVELAADGEERAVAATALALAEFGAGQLDRARITIAAHLASLLDEHPAASIVELALAGVGMAVTHGDYGIAADPDPRVIAAANHLDHPGQLGRLAGYRGASMVALGRVDEGLDLLERGIDLLERAGRIDDALGAIANRLLVGAFTDDLDRLVSIAERGRRLALRHGASPWRVAALTAVYADVLTRHGRLGDAERALDGTARRYAWRTSLELALAAALLAIEQADHERASWLLDRPDVSAAEQHPPAVLRRDVLRARADALAASPQPGSDQPDRLAARLLAACRAAPVTALALDGPRALTLLEQLWHPDAEWTLELDEVTAQVVAAASGARPTSHVAAELALAGAHRAAARDPDAAIGRWETAIETGRSSGCRLVAVEAQLGLARGMIAAGRRADAAALLDEVDGETTAIGASRLGDASRELRRRARLGRAASHEHAFGLTQRELEVLGLLASGWSNREIGEALYISAKTASVHVSNLLRKLDVPNRRVAARLAVELGLDRAEAGPGTDPARRS